MCFTQEVNAKKEGASGPNVGPPKGKAQSEMPEVGAAARERTGVLRNQGTEGSAWIEEWVSFHKPATKFGEN